MAYLAGCCGIQPSGGVAPPERSQYIHLGGGGDRQPRTYHSPPGHCHTASFSGESLW